MKNRPLCSPSLSLGGALIREEPVIVFSYAAEERLTVAALSELETWQKLAELARSASQSQPRPVTASDMAAAIVEQTVNGR